MKLTVFTSIGAKLFYVVSALVIITVAGNSWQNGRTFQTFLERHVADATILQAKDAAVAIEGAADGWESLIALAMHVDAGASGDALTRHLGEFVASSREYLAFQVLKLERGGRLVPVAFAFTSNVDSPRLEGQPPSKVAGLLAQAPLTWLPRRLGQDPGAHVLLHNISPTIGLPAVSMAVAFAHGDSTLWAVLTAWQTRLVSALPNSSLVKSQMIGSDGSVFGSPDLAATIAARPAEKDRLIRAALTSEAESSFVGYRDRDGVQWLGAFHRVPRYGIIVVVRRDAKSQYLATSTMVQRTAYWGWVFVLLAVLVSFILASGMTRRLRSVVHATESIAAGNFDTSLAVSGADEVSALSQAVSTMARQLKDFLATRMEKARMDSEMKTARLVQNAFFPKAVETPASAASALRVAGFYQPATECGGDWWGQFPCPDGSLFVCIGDVSGHGVGAALVTAMAYSCCMTAAELSFEEGRRPDSPARILARLNKLLVGSVGGEINMTFFVAHFDLAAGVLTYANAAHNFPVLLPASATDDRLPKGGVGYLSLKLPGQLLGEGRDAKFAEARLMLRPGDRLMLFTDGLIECENASGRPWGRKRLVQTLAKSAAEGAGPSTLVEAVRLEAFAHFGTVPLADDVTIVVAEVPKTWVPALSGRPQDVA